MEEKPQENDDFPSEVDFLPTPPRPPEPFDIWPNWHDGRVAIVFWLLCVLASLTQWQWLRMGRTEPPDLSASYQLVFVQGEYWRLVTAIFAHANFTHLANNSITLVVFSWVLSAYFGRWAFPIGGLIIGIASNAMTLKYYGSSSSLLGASGMNYGLVAMWLCLYIRFARAGSVSLRIMRAFGFALLMLFPQSYDPKVSYTAHLSGLVCGLIYGGLAILVLRPRFPRYAMAKRNQDSLLLH